MDDIPITDNDLPRTRRHAVILDDEIVRILNIYVQDIRNPTNEPRAESPTSVTEIY